MEGYFLDGHFFGSFELVGFVGAPSFSENIGTFPFLLVSALESHDERLADYFFFSFPALHLCVTMESISLRFSFFFSFFSGKVKHEAIATNAAAGMVGSRSVGTTAGIPSSSLSSVAQVLPSTSTTAAGTTTAASAAAVGTISIPSDLPSV